jgi:hypothetical protein
VISIILEHRSAIVTYNISRANLRWGVLIWQLIIYPIPSPVEVYLRRNWLILVTGVYISEPNHSYYSYVGVHLMERITILLVRSYIPPHRTIPCL